MAALPSPPPVDRGLALSMVTPRIHSPQSEVAVVPVQIGRIGVSQKEVQSET